MKKLLFLFLVLMGFTEIATAQVFAEPWTAKQLMETQTLARKITQNQNLAIISVGPDAVIKNSFAAKPASEPENIQNLKNYLQNISKDTEVVIYCGCCPFEKCPNIRPAFEMLKESGYKNAKLLNIPKNIKVDWIDKGYPTK